MASKFFIVKQVVEIEESEYRGWSTTCDEATTLGNILEHDGDLIAMDGVTKVGHSWLSSYGEVSKSKAEEMKYKTFTPEGGI